MPTEVDRSEVQRLISEGAQLVDVLPPDEFEAEHIIGAISIPLKALNRQSTAQLKRERPVITYCYDYQ